MKETIKSMYEAQGGLDKTMHQHHRDQTGSYYTPFEIAAETVKTAAARRLAYLFNTDPEAAARWLEQPGLEHPGSDPQPSEPQGGIHPKKYFDAMVHWHVADPAGGDGVFAAAWLDLLEKLADALGEAPRRVAEAARRVHLFDLQSEPVSHYKKMISSYFKLDLDDVWCYIGNVLDTERLFQQVPIAAVLAQGGYDLIVGNPPYIGEKNHKALFNEARRYPFGAAHYEKNMDYFYYFIHLGIALLAKGGVLGMITTGYFLTADGAGGLRAAMAESGSLVDMARFEGSALFKDAAGQSNVIFHFRKGVWEDCRYVEVPSTPKTTHVVERWRESGTVAQLNRQQIISRFGNFYFSLHPGEPMAVEEIEAACGSTFGERFQVRQGIVSGLDRTKSEGVFVLTPEEADLHSLESSLLVPFYKNSQVKRGKVDLESRYKMLYIPEEIEDFEKRYPNAFRHLNRFREPLSKRREVMNGVRPWYALQWPRNRVMFEGMKIVAPHRALDNAFAFCDSPYFGSADLYYLIPTDLSCRASMTVSAGETESGSDDSGQLSFWTETRGRIQGEKLTAAGSCKSSAPSDRLSREDLLTVSLILTTQIYEFWLSVRGKRKGEVLELYATPLRQMPLPPLNSACDDYARLKSMAVDFYERHGHLRDDVLRQTANEQVCQWLNLSEATMQTIQGYFNSKSGGKRIRKRRGHDE